LGEYVHQSIREAEVKKHGHKAKSFYRYSLEIVTEVLHSDRSDYGIPIPVSLSVYNPLMI
jgi:hypothetical protein